MRVILLALLLISSFAFKMRQNANGYTEAIADTQAAFGAGTQAFNDGTTLAMDAFNAATQQFNQVVGQLMSGLGALGGSRLQQGNVYGDAIGEAQTSANEAVQATQGLLNTGADVANAVLALTNQLVSQFAGAAGGRLQQGNPFAQAMADFQAAVATAVASAQDAITAGVDVLQDTADETGNILGDVEIPARLQQGNPLAPLMADFGAVANDLAAATTAAINAVAAGTEGAAAQADQLVGTFAGLAGGATRR